MGDILKGGSESAFAGSLAARIEFELDIVRGQYGLPALTGENKDDLRPLLLGIARGIVGYLGDNPEAFVIAQDSGANHQHGGKLSQIKTDP